MPRRTTEDDNPPPSREEIEASLAQRIFQVFELWNDCPLTGCRRNRCCLRDPCAIPYEPIRPGEMQWIGRLVRSVAAEHEAKRQASGVETEN